MPHDNRKTQRFNIFNCYYFYFSTDIMLIKIITFTFFNTVYQFLNEDIHLDNLQGCQIWHWNWVTSAPKRGKSGSFQDQFQYILARRFGANMPQFGYQIWPPWYTLQSPGTTEWGSGLDAMQVCLEMERDITQKLYDLHALASHHNDAQVGITTSRDFRFGSQSGSDWSWMR